ncbi:MAG TPA: hypothetical protein VFS43_39025 [Polyangiaceae bacterium]|nr:hypothetical protein [Polyangiaceae bacterium]
MPDDDPTLLRARLAELDRERAELIARLGPSADEAAGAPAAAAGGARGAPALSGRTVVAVLAGIAALAFVAASAIWFGGRTPWRARPVAESQPGLSREDVAGQALVQVLHACLAELDLRARVDARVRVVIAPNGSASPRRVEAAAGGPLVEACARRAPSLVRTRPAPGAAPAGLDVWFASEIGPDGTRVSRSGWGPAPL